MNAERTPTRGAPARASGGTAATEGNLLRAVAEYLTPADVTQIDRAIGYLHTIRDSHSNHADGATRLERSHSPGASGASAEYVLAVAQTLAESLHIDATTLVAVLLSEPVQEGLVSQSDVRHHVGGRLGEQVAHTIASLERFDALQRPAAALRRTASAEAAPVDGGHERGRERRRKQDADALRKMFIAMAEDPRVVIIKIADQLRLMRAVHFAADYWRAHPNTEAGVPASAADGHAAASAAEAPAWTLAECRVLAQETREIFAPLAARLGMGQVESELEDLAFAVLEPEEYQWLREAVATETLKRNSYVERVCAFLAQELDKIGIHGEVSGRVKHLYSIYKKVQRNGSQDLTALFDILAFRVIVPTVEDCYQVLGHIHEIWHPKDGRIKDFIASPKPNGYQSLHTTVFCLDDRLAEIQIRTPEMHELAEYGVAMHWYYKDVGDSASAQAHPLRAWVQQVKEWQHDLTAPQAGRAEQALEAVKGDVLQEQIYVFTPAGDAKELPAGSTPLDFAYRVHTDLGNHVAGVRITSDDGRGHLTKKLVPLDHELHNGDVIEIIKRADAHPTRDWLRVARTKLAQGRIQRFLNSQEREEHLQIGRDRLDRDLRMAGLRKGLEDLRDEDLLALSQESGHSSPDALYVAIGSEKVRSASIIAKLREMRRLPNQPVEAPLEEAAPATMAPTARTDEAVGASVQGMEGMLTHLAGCCNPLPGDELLGFISRGRGVIVHRADCPNLAYLVARQPERAIAVGWPRMESKQLYRAPIFVEGADRTGLLRDVTGVINGHKINMYKVEVVTKSRPDRAVISAVLEIQRPDDLTAVLRDLRAIDGVLVAERREPAAGKAGASSG